MLCLRLPYATCVLALLSATTVQADDLHFKKNITVGGSPVSSSEVWIKGSRERSVSATPGGNVVTLRQCDLKRTVTLNEQSQAYLVESDPQDDAAVKAAALLGKSQPPRSGGTVTQTSTIVDTGERKTVHGYAARHLKSTVVVEASADACSQVHQKYELDGWYTDLVKEQSACAQSLPPIRQNETCGDRVIVRHKGTAKPGYALLETITLTNEDGSVTKIDTATTEISKQALSADLFELPGSYREVKSQAELYQVQQAAQQQWQGQPQAMQSVAYSQPMQPQMHVNALGSGGMSQFAGMAAGLGGQNAMMAQAQQMSQVQQMAMMQQDMAGQFPNSMPGMQQQPVAGAAVPLPQALGPKAPGKIRIGVAPAQAQLGQGNNAQADYGTPIRNAIIFVMAGPAVEITPLDSRIAVQIQAEAQQKQCDYILFSGVTVKHGGGGFGKFMKAAGPMSSMIPMAGMGGGMGGMIAGQAAGAAMQTAAQAAQQQAMNQLAGFNGQIKSKDDVTVEYHLFPTGQPTAKLESSLKGKAKSDGEDVLSPLIQQAANNILTEVTKK